MWDPGLEAAKANANYAPNPAHAARLRTWLRIRFNVLAACGVRNHRENNNGPTRVRSVVPAYVRT